MEEEKKVEVIEPKADEKQGMSIAAMVLGIVALVFLCSWPISITCGVLAVVFGLLRFKKTPGKGMAVAGFVTGVVALAFWVMFFGLMFLGFSMF